MFFGHIFLTPCCTSLFTGYCALWMVNCSMPAGFIHPDITVCSGAQEHLLGQQLCHRLCGWAHFWCRIWNAAGKAGCLRAGHQPAPQRAWQELQDGAASDLASSPCHGIPAAWPRDTL